MELPAHEVIAEVDARRVERILRNLIANAIDHAEHKPVRIRMGADEDTVAVTVRDYGVGLRPGEEKLVFSRFWRADPSRVRRSGAPGWVWRSASRTRGYTRAGWKPGGTGPGLLLPADAAAGARPQGDHQPVAHETDPATRPTAECAGTEGSAAPA
ncbi:histidine kinase-, DNA gyrase B-, and HSP90-like ATPase family protein [Mycobacterium kansasii]|uniref:histidine kinase n=1 Tax=Mycobacterium kansasii TaxID=1768 RepID=A0A1V3XR28_MYCKA|nr:histidine kinase-, DNA gyrase B-, and HSP90-like ATPase family protein [Mycobacterium kansasii]